MLDTSVLVADPDGFTRMGPVDVVIPITVIEELDGLKTRPDDVGRSARAALRALEDLRTKAGGSLADGFRVNDDLDAPTVCIELNGVQTHLLHEHGLDPRKEDNRIIGAALGQTGRGPTRLVSNDAANPIAAG